jgi:uncharacterized protein (TIGR03435 family)
MITLRTWWLHATRLTAYVLVFASGCLLIPRQAQSLVAAPPEPVQPPPMRFEVASIHARQTAGDEPSDRKVLPGGRFVATATTVRTLLRVAFKTDDNCIVGAPGWIDNETFDINAATVNHTEISSPEQLQELIVSLLEDRFAFRFHRGEKDTAVYWLELDKPGRAGPGLRPSSPDTQANMSSNSNGTATMKASKASMADLAAALRRQAGRPVEDHTGLAGDFDFEMEWARDESPDSTVPSLFTVLKEQLGLKLRPAKGTTETLVIDQISHPSDN